MNDIALLITGAGIALFTDRAVPGFESALKKAVADRKTRKQHERSAQEAIEYTTAKHPTLVGKRYTFRPRANVELQVVISHLGGSYHNRAFLRFLDPDRAEALGFRQGISVDIEAIDPTYWADYLSTEPGLYRPVHLGDFTPDP